MRWIAWAGVLAATGAWSQTTSHPIDTKPEGQPQKECSYTVSDKDGNLTGTSNCTPSEARAERQRKKQKDADALDAPDPDAQGTGTQKDTSPSDSLAKRFPFPGETTSPATNSETPPASPGSSPGLSDAGSSGESSSSSSSSSSSGDSSSSNSNASSSPDDVNSDMPPAPKRNLHRKPAPPPPDIATREAEDLKVAHFYQEDGNFRGAYGRAQDAITLAEDDPEAHLALALAARKLGKLDEAEKHFRRTLELDPFPKTRKQAEQALKEMTGGV